MLPPIQHVDGRQAAIQPRPDLPSSSSIRKGHARTMSSTPHLEKFLPDQNDFARRNRSISPSKSSRIVDAHTDFRSRHLSTASLPRPPATHVFRNPSKRILDPDQSAILPESPAIKRNSHLLSSTHNLADFRLTQSIISSVAGDQSFFPAVPILVEADSPDQSAIMPESPAIKRNQSLLRSTNRLADLTLEELKGMRPETAMSLYTDASFLLPRAPDRAEKISPARQATQGHPRPVPHVYDNTNQTLALGGAVGCADRDESNFDLLRDEMSFMRAVGETSVFL